MTNLESLYWSEEFTDAELNALANAGSALLPAQTQGQPCDTYAWFWEFLDKNAEWFDNNRDTQW